MTTTPARQQKGAPAGIGGQFAETTKGETTSGLVEDSSSAADARDRITAIRLELAALVKEAPEAVYDLAEEAIRLVTHESTPPAVLLGDPEEEGGQRELIDPYTGRPTDLVAVESGTRWTRTSDYDSHEGAITFSYGSDPGDFDTIAYRSGSSGRFVELPDGWEEEYA